MKKFTNAIASAALLIAIANPATAAISSAIGRDIQAAAGTNSSVRIVVDGDTVILHGYVENEASFQNIERAARENGAARVINSVLKTN